MEWRALRQHAIECLAAALAEVALDSGAALVHWERAHELDPTDAGARRVERARLRWQDDGCLPARIDWASGVPDLSDEVLPQWAELSGDGPLAAYLPIVVAEWPAGWAARLATAEISAITYMRKGRR